MRSDARKRNHPDTVTIALPFPKPPITANRRAANHYAHAARVRNTHEVLAAALAGVAPIAGCDKLTLHYRPTTWHRRDPDGMDPTKKVVTDALVRAGFLPDDSFVCVSESSSRIHEPVPGQPSAMWVTAEGVTHFEPGARP